MEKLDAIGLPQFIKDAVLEEISTLTGTIPEGTLLGQFIGSAVGSFLAIGICGVAVFVVAKILMLLTKGILNAIARSSAFISKINVLGGIVAGAFKAFVIICIILAVLSIVPVEGISNIFDETLLLKGLYHNNPVMSVFAWFTKM